MTDVYAEVKAHFQDRAGVTVNSGRGAQGIKVRINGKERMIIMFSKGDLLVQYSPARTSELIDRGDGRAYDPGTGRPMKDRVLFPHSDKERWIERCEESIAFFLGT